MPAAHYQCGGVKTDHERRDDASRAVRDRRVRAAPACTARTAWRPTRCSRAWCCSSRAARRSSRDRSRVDCARADGRAVVSPATRPSTNSIVDRPQLGRDPPAHVVLRRHRAHRQAPRARAPRASQILRDEIREYYWNFKITSDLLELRNLATVAALIVECASAPRKPRPALHARLSGDRPPFSSATPPCAESEPGIYCVAGMAFEWR